MKIKPVPTGLQSSAGTVPAQSRLKATNRSEALQVSSGRMRGAGRGDAYDVSRLGRRTPATKAQRRGHQPRVARSLRDPGDVLMEDWLVVWGMARIISDLASSVCVDGGGLTMGGLSGSALLCLLDGLVDDVRHADGPPVQSLTVFARVDGHDGVALGIEIGGATVNSCLRSEGANGDTAIGPTAIEAVFGGTRVRATLAMAVATNDTAVLAARSS